MIFGVLILTFLINERPWLIITSFKFLKDFLIENFLFFFSSEAIFKALISSNLIFSRSSLIIINASSIKSLSSLL